MDLLRQSKSQQLAVASAKAQKARRKETRSGDDGWASWDGRRGKAFSADAINELDPYYLTEALMNLADEQPVVARSVPKHAAIYPDERKREERLRRDCLFEREIYDKMMADSLLICDLLQSHLSDCIAGVRAKSPTALSSPFTSPPVTPILSRSQSSGLQPQPEQLTNSPPMGYTRSRMASPWDRQGQASTVGAPKVRISVSNGHFKDDIGYSTPTNRVAPFPTERTHATTLSPSQSPNYGRYGSATGVGVSARPPISPQPAHSSMRWPRSNLPGAAPSPYAPLNSPANERRAHYSTVVNEKSSWS